jgi:DNA repair protein RecO (recombination protein O)
VLTYRALGRDNVALMALLTTEALVLRAYKLGETSKVVVLLTRERGKVRAVARGARGGRPRYQSALETLSEVRVTLHGRQGAELLRLGQAELLHSAFRVGERGLEAALFLSVCAELLDAFSPEGEADGRVYRLALAVLRAVEGGANPDLVGRYLEAWLLRLHGLYPPLDQCASCGGALGAGRVEYHRPAQGFVCGDCGPASGPILPERVRSLLGEIFSNPPTNLRAPAAPHVRALESFQNELVTRHLERDLRSPRVIREATREAAR